MSVETCPQDGLKQLTAMGTHWIHLAEPTFRFRHFGAVFARAHEKPVHGACAIWHINSMPHLEAYLNMWGKTTSEYKDLERSSALSCPVNQIASYGGKHAIDHRN
jgi:hypothetical protein